MKTKFVKLFIAISCLFAALTAQSQTLTLTPTNGTCLSDCKITAVLTGATGNVTYAKLKTPSGTETNPIPVPSGVFENLLPGE
jgi:hypothetical protein